MFFDFSKAFDPVDHRIMLQKLRFYGIRDRELLVFESYFANKIKICTGSGKYLFLENALKKTTEYFLKFLFLFESTILPFNNGK